jgi:hypothetical protein
MTGERVIGPLFRAGSVQDVVLDILVEQVRREISVLRVVELIGQVQVGRLIGLQAGVSADAAECRVIQLNPVRLG